MTVRKRAIKKMKHFNIPVSYEILNDTSLSDARNVFDNKGVTETRYGIKGWNSTSLAGSILSLSYFKKSDGTRYKLAKVGTVLYSVAASGAHTSIKTGLSATTKHRAVTLTDRHIIAIESDGLFSYDGTNFTALGQLPPTTGSVAVSNGGTLTDANNFKVGLTFYSTTTGFETNVYESAQVTTASPNRQIAVTSIPATATNLTINKVRVYLKNTTSNTEYLFITELALGTTSYTITANATSTLIPPTKNAPPLSGGAKYISLFGKKIAIAGNSSYPNEVFFSEEYLPDAFDSTTSQIILQIPGQGPITGIGTGLFDDSTLSPFLACFKKTNTTIYSELSNNPVLTTIDDHIGCISNDTIRIRNGSIYFMSENGWNFITRGSLVKDSNGNAFNLGNGAIDGIFTRVGWQNELNIQQGSSFFSCYFSTNFHYMTFVSEGSSTEIKKAYVYEEKIKGFRIFEFKTVLTCAVEGEDDSGYQCIFLGDTTGKIFTYSSRNERHDDDYLGNQETIPAYISLAYIQSGDDATSYNYRNLVVRAAPNGNSITVQAIPSFSFDNYSTIDYSFPTSSGFILDVSQLDIDSFGGESQVTTVMADINLTGETLLLKFSQDILDANIGLVSGQIDLNKNGNRNN